MCWGLQLHLQFCQMNLFCFYKQTRTIVYQRLLLGLNAITSQKSGKLLLSCSGRISFKTFQCHLATAEVQAIPPHFSSLTQLASTFSLTAKLSGRVCFPCCGSVLRCWISDEVSGKLLFILPIFEVCRWKFPCSLAYRFTLYWKIPSGIDWNITWLSREAKWSTEGK